MDLNDPITVLLAAAEALERAHLRHAAYGGLALAVYGQPRETRDADLAVAGGSSDDVEAALEAVGLHVTMSFERVCFGGHLITRFAVIDGDALNTVDLVQPRAPWFADAALDRALTGTLRSRTVAVLSPEDFVLFKVLSTRERDLEDARTVVAGLPGQLDLSWIDRDGRRLANEIADHDITERLQSVLPGP